MIARSLMALLGLTLVVTGIGLMIAGLGIPLLVLGLGLFGAALEWPSAPPSRSRGRSHDR